MTFRDTDFRRDANMHVGENVRTHTPGTHLMNIDDPRNVLCDLPDALLGLRIYCGINQFFYRRATDFIRRIEDDR